MKRGARTGRDGTGRDGTEPPPLIHEHPVPVELHLRRSVHGGFGGVGGLGRGVGLDGPTQRRPLRLGLGLGV